MFKKDAPDEIVSLLGDGVEISGEISFANGLRVDGVVKGRLRSEGVLIIGPKGRVEAEVFTRKVSISGEFRGSLHATDRVEVHSEGKVYGDLFTPCLIIEAGAIFEGKCNMSDREAPKRDEANVLKMVESKAEPSEPAQQAAASEKSWPK